MKEGYGADVGMVMKEGYVAEVEHGDEGYGAEMEPGDGRVWGRGGAWMKELGRVWGQGGAWGWRGTGQRWGMGMEVGYGAEVGHGDEGRGWWLK